MAKPEYDKHGYSLSLQNVSGDFWYYEEKKGLTCIFQPHDAKGNVLFHWPSWTIPWRILDRTFERRRNVKAKSVVKRQKA